MPLQRSCSLSALQSNITELVGAGHARDQAVAIAHATLREACHDEGKPSPTAREVAGIAKAFKRAPGQRTVDYLESALSAAKAKLPHADYAVIHQAARGRAGGLASARLRTSVEKGLLLGPQRLTFAELDDARARAELLAASDARLGIDSGGEYLAQLFWAEKARRSARATKSDPGPGDVHVPSTDWRKGKTAKEALPGGAGSKLTPADVDADELAMGIREELEHTNDRQIAQEIALDHLAENPRYYSKLRQVMKADRSADPGVMIALRVPTETAKLMTLSALEGAEPPNKMHVTLAYLGRMSKVTPAGLMAAADAIAQVTATPVLVGYLAGVGRFPATESSDGKDVVVRLVDVPGLTDLRARLVTCLRHCGLEVNAKHDFTPHVTLAYVDPSKVVPLKPSLQDVCFDNIVLSVNDADTVFPLGQPDPLAAAYEQADAAVEAPPAAVTVEEVDETGAARVHPAAGEDLVDMVAKSALPIEPGDVVELSVTALGDLQIERASASLLPATPAQVGEAIKKSHSQNVQKAQVPFVGPDDARVVFVSGAPSDLEMARKEPLVGPDGSVFVDRYLKPLGLSRDQVVVGFACPVLPDVPAHELSFAQTAPFHDALVESLSRWPQATVVAVGKAAAEALGERALLWLPHPCAARLNEARYDQQLDRKLRRVRKALDEGFANVEPREQRTGQSEIVAGRIGESLKAEKGSVLVPITKSAAEKQIVYGVVLDPYSIDTQGEWVPPSVVEAAAHEYLRKSRVVGREHVKKDTAELLESWCVHYPTAEDYKLAMGLQPHSVYEIPFGNDKIHSGTWVAGVRLGDAAWDAYRRGEITGFSIGGFSAKTTIDRGAMPKVKIVPLVEKRDG